MGIYSMSFLKSVCVCERHVWCLVFLRFKVFLALLPCPIFYLVSIAIHYIGMYGFSRRFYPKRLTVHSGYTFLSVYVFPGNWTHNLLRCKRNALPTEPQEPLAISISNHLNSSWLGGVCSLGSSLTTGKEMNGNTNTKFTLHDFSPVFHLPTGFAKSQTNARNRRQISACSSDRESRSVNEKIHWQWPIQPMREQYTGQQDVRGGPIIIKYFLFF